MPRILATIVETTNPAACAWNLKGQESPSVTWVRDSRSLYLGMKSEDGRWHSTNISNESFQHDGTLHGAREAARRFLLTLGDE